MKEFRRPRVFSAESFALLPAEVALRGDLTEIRLAEGVGDFILNFYLPKKALPGYRYEGQILDRDKKVIWDIKDLKAVGRYETFSVFAIKRFLRAGIIF